MRDFIDFVKDIVKDGYQQVNQQDVGDEQVHRHGDGRDPPARDALPVAHVFTARRGDFRCEHLPV